MNNKNEISLNENYIRKMVKDEFVNNIMQNIDSSLIFMYIQNLERKEEKLNNLIDKTTNYYLKTLAKNGSMPDEAVEMYNLLEQNKR